jgi:hypothetical protein
MADEFVFPPGLCDCADAQLEWLALREEVLAQRPEWRTLTGPEFMAAVEAEPDEPEWWDEHA